MSAPTAEANLGLVHLCANRFRGRGIEYEELYSAGCIGLLKAVKAFDQNRGVQFSTYAVPVILGEMKRLFRDGGTVKVSRTLKEHAMQLQQLQEMFQQVHGRAATIAELSQGSGLSSEAVAEALCAAQPPLSLTAAAEENQLDIPVPAPDTELGDVLALRQVMQTLPKPDQLLLQMRYFQNMTQTEIAKRLGISQVQVSRKEKKLLTHLRTELLQ
ncbi:MAG: sigma-70 family RNA polymerase sigma factor [Oscillospiraceae bacterium]|nr:sigma-70 family RNA polymerase sigma factor [Oscillospiraceae bacterium]